MCTLSLLLNQLICFQLGTHIRAKRKREEMQQIYMCVKVVIIMIDLFLAGNSHPGQEEEGRDAADI